MAGTLSLVGTPIGNLGDMTPRAVETLQKVDFIAAEDTRVTAKLLNHFAIKKPMVSYYAHNIREQGERILERLLAGENCAIVTDAGMPCISDPGEDLVRLCAEAGIQMEVVPSASAVIAALCVSGLPTARFSFEGFLSTTKKNRFAHLSEVCRLPHTLVFYEAPHKLRDTLADLLEGLGNRRIAVVKELTKIHEQVFRGTIKAAMTQFESTVPKGEFVLVVEGAAPLKEDEMSLEDAIAFARSRVEQGEKAAQAARQAAELSGYKKSEIYRALL